MPVADMARPLLMPQLWAAGPAGGGGGGNPSFGEGLAIDDFSASLDSVWKMDDAAGPINNVSNGPDLQANGSPTFQQTGKDGFALKFNTHLTDHLVTSGNYGPAQTSSYAISLWVKPLAALSGNRCIFRFGSGGTGIVLQLNNASTTGTFNFYDSISCSYNVGSDVTDIWTHVFCRRHKAGGVYYKTLFLNGVQVISTNNTSLPFNAAADKFWVARDFWNNQSYQGLIDEIVYWNFGTDDGVTVPDGDAIAELYNSGNGRFFS